MKPITEFHENKTNKRGYQYQCKPCFKLYFDDWNNMRRHTPAMDVPTSKKCLTCKQEKPISQFGKRTRAKDKRNSYCKECWKDMTKKWQRTFNLKRNAANAQEI